MLPDVALLEVFDFYVKDEMHHMWRPRTRDVTWYTLVHVCRKWRNVVFGSPRRLNLRLYCGDDTPVRETLDVWPPIPIAVRSNILRGEDNINAALEYNNRICDIILWSISSPLPASILAALHQPFPTLTKLYLSFKAEITVDPASFLGGSLPALLSLTFRHGSFPGLPKLLLSATHLVELSLFSIPLSGYITPEAMIASLSVLTRLEKLRIEFKSPRCCPDRTRRRPPPPTRTLLPVLAKLEFDGVSEYLEDLVAGIDAPLLKTLDLSFFHQLIFDTPRLTQLINRTPNFKEYSKSYVFFDPWVARVTFTSTYDGWFRFQIKCRPSDWRLSSLAQICSASIPRALIPTLENLYFSEDIGYGWPWQDDMEGSQWLEVLHPFTAVKSLYLTRELAPRVAPALQELAGERVTEVLPALQTIFLYTHTSGPVQEAIEQFVAARQLASHPITISHWDSHKDW